jgi:hypothetical protein
MSKTSNHAKLECLKIWIENRKYKPKKKIKPLYVQKDEDED